MSTPQSTKPPITNVTSISRQFDVIIIRQKVIYISLYAEVRPVHDIVAEF